MKKILSLVTLFLFLALPFLTPLSLVNADEHDAPGAVTGKNIRSVFGEVKPPDQLLPFLQSGGSGRGGIYLFINNLITLIYVFAGIIFVFLILWGAWDILVSGGDKEKVQEGKNRITYAIIGILLFAVAFAVIALFGDFTGFQFFNQQNITGEGEA